MKYSHIYSLGSDNLMVIKFNIQTEDRGSISGLYFWAFQTKAQIKSLAAIPPTITLPKMVDVRETAGRKIQAITLTTGLRIVTCSLYPTCWDKARYTPTLIFSP